MGWSFRKSIKLGAVRLNLSKSGVGGSVGVKGYRKGIDAKGRKSALRVIYPTLNGISKSIVLDSVKEALKQCVVKVEDIPQEIISDLADFMKIKKPV